MRAHKISEVNPPEHPSKVVKRKLHKYDESQLMNALDAVNNGETIRAACRRFGVPRGTVQDRLHGRVGSGPRKMGPDAALSRDEEKQLADWCIKIQEAGFIFKLDYLLSSVELLLLETKSPNRFKNGRPGKKWFQGFLKRNPEINEHKLQTQAKAPTKKKTADSRECKKEWFSNLKQFLKDENLFDIVEDPTRIYNADDIGFSICPKFLTVLGPKRSRASEVTESNSTKSLTVALAISANGDILPPCIVYPFLRLPKPIIQSVPDGWLAEKSDSGNMKSKVYMNFIQTQFHNWLNHHNIKRPVLLLVDKHKAHLTMQLTKFCSDNGIVLHPLPTVTTHIKATEFALKPLKSKWITTINQWRSRPENIDKHLDKINFCSLLNFVLDDKNISFNIKNGFQKCGLYPFDAEGFTDLQMHISNFTEEDMEDDDEVEVIIIKDRLDDMDVDRAIQQQADPQLQLQPNQPQSQIQLQLHQPVQQQQQQQQQQSQLQLQLSQHQKSQLQIQLQPEEKQPEQQQQPELQPQPQQDHQQFNAQCYNLSDDELNTTINFLKRLNDADPNFHLEMTLNYLTNFSNGNPFPFPAVASVERVNAATDNNIITADFNYHLQ